MAEEPIDLASLTWTCMVCGQERPDSCISVAPHPVRGLEQWFPATRTNVAYCNDRPLCAVMAYQQGPWVR